MEELRPDGLGHLSRSDPATLAAWAEGNDLMHRDVYDVNGTRLGRVTRCFAEEGALVRCDVSLSDNAKGLLGADRDVAAFPPNWIGRVEQDGVHLTKAGEQLVSPENPRPVGAERNATGAKGQPRKVR